LGLKFAALAPIAISFVEGCFMARDAWDRMEALENLKDEVKGLKGHYSELKEEFNTTFALVRKNL
jgi:hypothetical protein